MPKVFSYLTAIQGLVLFCKGGFHHARCSLQTKLWEACLTTWILLNSTTVLFDNIQITIKCSSMYIHHTCLRQTKCPNSSTIESYTIDTTVPYSSSWYWFIVESIECTLSTQWITKFHITVMLKSPRKVQTIQHTQSCTYILVNYLFVWRT